MAESSAEATMLKNLEANTGRPLSHWVGLVTASGLAKHGAIVTMLKRDHGFTHGYANLVAHKALKSDAGSAAAGGEDLVSTQYGGARAALRPIYEAIMKKVAAFGDDVEVAPKKAYVSLRRARQFAILQPSTAARLDVGLNLKGVAARGRLEAAGSWNAMCTHRVRIEQAAQADAELIGWLRKAYDAAG